MPDLAFANCCIKMLRWAIEMRHIKGVSVVDNIKIAIKGAQAEITEKKSRFIATIRPVSSEEEAGAFIEEMKKKYWDARHNCSAFVIGDNNEMTRCSDDGEPAGTAGRPMLEVLMGEGWHNICVVVTRYFGGVLLGTGGLIRAYQGAVKEGLKLTEGGYKCKGERMHIITSYNDYAKVKDLFLASKGVIEDVIYQENVELVVVVRDEDVPGKLEALANLTLGKANVINREKCEFTTCD